MRHYTHVPLGREVKAVGGYYYLQSEKRVPYQGRELLVAVGHGVVDSSCCGSGGCGFAVVPGYVVQWKNGQNEKGEPLSDVEPIREEKEQEAIRELILSSEKVQQVNFL